MKACAFNDKIEAYHDGELDASDRAAVEAHLAECGECSARLTELRAMSDLLTSASATRPALSQIALHRLHHRLQSVTDRGLIRLGWALSGVAASLLLIGSVWLTRVQQTAPSAPAAPPWVGVSLALDTESTDTATASPAAEFYLADASTRVGNVP
jgi:anti-sigma factor RsiW